MENITNFNTGHTAKNSKKSSNKPTISKISKQAICITGAAALALASIASVSYAKKEHTNKINSPASYDSYYSNTTDYTITEEDFQKFTIFENQLRIYEELSQNPNGINYVQRQALAKAEEYIKSNYNLLEKVYLYQAKAKVAGAYGLPQEKLSSIKTNVSPLYTTIKGADIPTISDEPISYLGKVLGNTSNTLIPKELEKAIENIAILQINKDFSCDELLDKYHDFLTFLSFEFQADEKGNISISDKAYTPSAKDIVEFYSPLYENLKAKKEANGGKLKSSQEKRLQEIMNKMYDSLLECVDSMIGDLENTDPNSALPHRNALNYILNLIPNQITTNDAFAILYGQYETLEEIRILGAQQVFQEPNQNFEIPPIDNNFGNPTIDDDDRTVG